MVTLWIEIFMIIFAAVLTTASGQIETEAAVIAEYRIWVQEPRVEQQYAAYMSILNRNFSADLSSPDSTLFKTEAEGIKTVVSPEKPGLIFTV